MPPAGLCFTDDFLFIFLTARSRDVAMVTDLWHVSAKIDTPRLHSVRNIQHPTGTSQRQLLS